MGNLSTYQLVLICISPFLLLIVVTFLVCFTCCWGKRDQVVICIWSLCMCDCTDSIKCEFSFRNLWRIHPGKTTMLTCERAEPVQDMDRDNHYWTPSNLQHSSQATSQLPTLPHMFMRRLHRKEEQQHCSVRTSSLRRPRQLTSHQETEAQTTKKLNPLQNGPTEQHRPETGLYFELARLYTHTLDPMQHLNLHRVSYNSARSGGGADSRFQLDSSSWRLCQGTSPQADSNIIRHHFVQIHRIRTNLVNCWNYVR